jgi:leader peptidase (prepilin peptidase)/N-methyltransferase
MLIAWTAAVGLVVGSFLNVCIYRLPREESLVLPGSRCPACRTPIRPWDNIPVLSFLLLRGRCRACGHPISWRYPLVEALTGGLFVMTVDRFGPTPLALSLVVLLSALIVVAFIDIDHQIIPNVITLPGIPFGLLLGLVLAEPSILDRILGALGGAGFLYLVLFYGGVLYGQEVMGEGDLNLIALIGAFLGWRGVVISILVGCVSGSLIGLLLIARGRLARGQHMPFGPFLCLGAAAALFWGDDLIAWYVQLVR